LEGRSGVFVCQTRWEGIAGFAGGCGHLSFVSGQALTDVVVGRITNCGVEMGSEKGSETNSQMARRVLRTIGS
jgi:hypothetical protein